MEQLDTLTSLLAENHKKYIAESIMVGFTKTFPESTDRSHVADEEAVETTCNGIKIKFNVRLSKVVFGENNQYFCTGIVTDRVRLPNIFNSGWGSHSYADEAKIMEEAIVWMAAKHNLMIFRKNCSWPFASAIVGPVENAHLRCFKNKSHDDRKSW